MPHKKNLTTSSLAVSVQIVERKIYLIRGHKVMIDIDLAELYRVPTRVLNQQVQRNRKRFPEDFMFQLNKEEAENLRSQFVISRSPKTDAKLAEGRVAVTICDLKIAQKQSKNWQQEVCGHTVTICDRKKVEVARSQPPEDSI